MDVVVAQDRYAEALEGVRMVLILGTMLHGIGVGNMLPSWVRVVCVDINPAVVTKLADRGSSQTLGLVTDAGCPCITWRRISRDAAGPPPAWRHPCERRTGWAVIANREIAKSRDPQIAKSSNSPTHLLW